MKLLKTRTTDEKVALLTLSIITSSLIAVTDYLTKSKFSFSAFYLVPIMLSTWSLGRKYGFLVSLFSSLVWLVSDFFQEKFIITSFLPYGLTLLRVSIYFIATYILSIQSELEKVLKIEKNLARKDALTGVANRRAFFEISEFEIRRSKRYKRPFTLAYIDLDNFKYVNDNFGHDAGDELLREVTKTFKLNIRDIDIAARLSGDEFVLLFPETGQELAKVALNRVHKGLTFAMQKKEWPVTFSIGVITFIKPPNSADEMIKKADEVMYSVKKSGKNNISYSIYQGQEALDIENL